MQQAGVEGSRDVDEMFDATYAALRRVAGKCFQKERNGITLQPTAVVHETYLRLARQPQCPWPDRVTFLAYAARVMRQILVDEARRRKAKKRGGRAQRVTLVDDMLGVSSGRTAVLDVHQALERLEQLDTRKGIIVQMRFFAGLSIEDVAEVLSLSVATVNREWRSARAWLGRELGREPDTALEAAGSMADNRKPNGRKHA